MVGLRIVSPYRRLRNFRNLFKEDHNSVSHLKTAGFFSSRNLNFTPEDMGKAIYIVGPAKMQNALLATYVEQATGISCEPVEDASHVPVPKRETAPEERLILWDCIGNDVETCLSAMSGNGSKWLGQDDLLGLFNLGRQGSMEEECLSRGVRGFFYQGDSVDQLMKGIQALFDGELWLSRKIMTRYVLHNHKPLFSPNEQKLQVLTRREKEILSMVAQGASNSMIADQLCISTHTVKTHLHNIFKKIDTSNRLQAALWAAKNI